MPLLPVASAKSWMYCVPKEVNVPITVASAIITGNQSLIPLLKTEEAAMVREGFWRKEMHIVRAERMIMAL